MWFVSINLVMIISFGINPVSGGTPARDSIAILNIGVIIIFRLNRLWSVLMVFDLLYVRIPKIGRTTIEYMMKYVMQNVDLLIDSIDVIQPIWPIDE